MECFNGAIIETSGPQEYIYTIGWFCDDNWDMLVEVWPSFMPTQRIQKLSELLPPDGYTGPIWIGAVKDENGRWYDPNWQNMTPEQRAAYLESAK